MPAPCAAGPSQLQAAVSAVHCDAPTAAETDWAAGRLSDQLLELAPTPVVALNRAVALDELDGAEAALAVVEDLVIDRYAPWHAARADLPLLARSCSWHTGSVIPDVARGREAFARRAWSEAHAALAVARENGALGPVELEQLAVACYFLGNDDESFDAWGRAHRAWLDVGNPDRAARAAAWLGLGLLLRGEMARASGWFNRGRRLVADAGDEGAGRGYLLVPEAIELLEQGDAAGAHARYEAVVRIAERCGDTDLLALGLMGLGEVAVHQGETQRGLALLDDAMVSVTTGEVSDQMAGLLYCAVLEVCMNVFDLRRGVEWTEAFTRWCGESGVVAYRGQCLIHRSQILQAHGRWVDALSEADRAETWLARLQDPSVGLALYQRGELHRLRGELEQAQACYHRAAELGHEPVPGLALLRLAEGQLDTAATTVLRMLGEADSAPARLAVLPAVVEIALAAGRLDTAQEAKDELVALTADTTTPYLEALAASADGAVSLAAGDAPAALAALRRAVGGWRDLGMPYEQARAQLLVGDACRAVGDHQAADAARNAARRAFERLGAVIDLADVEGCHAPGPAAEDHGVLTERECEVLRLVAQGGTNREIGAALVISEHTAARHVQNIFTKIGVGSRAAATAWAYEHGIV